MLPDLRPLIGLPWEECDCWKLIARAYRLLFGIELPSYDGTDPDDRRAVAELIRSGKNDWVQVFPGTARFGDVILFSIQLLEPTHCGMVVDAHRMLHVTQASMSAVDWWKGDRARVWGHRVVDIRRHAELAQTP